MRPVDHRPSYGGLVRKDPDSREPRGPAVAIWTVTGLLVGVALAIVTGSFMVSIVICAAIGLIFGLYITRTKHVPTDD